MHRARAHQKKKKDDTGEVPIIYSIRAKENIVGVRKISKGETRENQSRLHSSSPSPVDPSQRKCLSGESALEESRQ
jgi:hypothetical protein